MDNLFRGCLVFNFRRTARFITKLFDEALEEAGVQYTQLYLLCKLSNLKDSEKCTMTHIADEVGITRTAFLRNLNNLERMGLVSTVRKSFKDRKLLKYFSISEKGREALTLGKKKWDEAHKKFSTSLLNSANSLKKENDLQPTNYSHALLDIFDIVNHSIVESRNKIYKKTFDDTNENGEI